MATEAYKRKLDAFQAKLTNELASVFLHYNEPLPNIKRIFKTKGKLRNLRNFELGNVITELKGCVRTLCNTLLSTEEIPSNELDCGCAVVLLTTLIFLNFEETRKSTDIIEIISTLCNLLWSKTLWLPLKDLISILCERFLLETDKRDRQAMPNIGKSVLNYLLDVTLFQDETFEKHIIRIYAQRNLIKELGILRDENDLGTKFYETMKSHPYLLSKKGKLFIGFLISRNADMVLRAHKVLLDTLSTMPVEVAAGYGTVYYEAWRTSKGPVRKLVEEEAIQEIMCLYFKYSRRAIDKTGSGEKYFAILSKLHAHKRTSILFNYTVTRLYMPFIWRNLSDYETEVRSNAADVLFDAFPLLLENHSKPQREDYVKRQINFMKKYLNDSTTYVRAITIIGTFAVLSRNLDLFPIEDLKEILGILFEKVPFDSSWLLRSALLQGIKDVFEDTSSAFRDSFLDFIYPLFNGLKGLFCDQSSIVRQLFLKVLIKIKEHSSDLKYWELIPLNGFIRNLPIEGPGYCTLVSKLLKEDIYYDGQNEKSLIKHICKMIDWSLTGAKILFAYSRCAFSVNEAYSFIQVVVQGITSKLISYKEYLEKEQMSVDNVIEDDIAGEAGPSTSSATSSKSKPVAPQYKLLENPQHVAGLIEIVAIMWRSFYTDLESDSELLNNLYELASKSIPLLVDYYKGTIVYYDILKYASVIPVHIIEAKTALISECISELRMATDSTDDTKIRCVIHALCSWKLGNELIKIIKEYLNHALQGEHLQSKKNKRTPKRIKLSKVPKKNCKSNLALKLLDFAISSSRNCSFLKTHNYDELVDLYYLLEKIKVVMLKRLNNPEDFGADSSITDDFLVKAFSLHLRLMRLIHRPFVDNVSDDVVHFDSVAASSVALSFAMESLIPHVPRNGFSIGSETPFVVRCCISVLHESNMLLSKGITNEAHCKSLCAYATDILSVGGIWFLEYGAETMGVVTRNARKYLIEREEQLLTTILPPLQSKLLGIISDLEITSESASKIFKAGQVFKTNLFSYSEIVLKHHELKSELARNSIKALLDTCLRILTNEINKTASFTVHRKLTSLPLFVSNILVFLLTNGCRDVLIPNLVFHIKNSQKNGSRLLSSLSILYTLIYDFKYVFFTIQIEKALQTCYRVMMSDYKPRRKSPDAALLRSEKLDIANSAYPIFREICQRINTSISTTDESGSEDEDELIRASKNRRL